MPYTGVTIDLVANSQTLFDLAALIVPMVVEMDAVDDPLWVRKPSASKSMPINTQYSFDPFADHCALQVTLNRISEANLEPE